MNRILRAVLYTLVGLGALAAFGWFFVSQLGGRSEGLAGVVLAPPPDYAVVDLGELAPAAAAAELEAQLARTGGDKVGLRFERQGAIVYWFADVPGDRLEEISAGASGTRLQTVWQGGLRQRLSWARAEGNFDAPGLPGPEKKNLYH